MESVAVDGYSGFVRLIATYRLHSDDMKIALALVPLALALPATAQAKETHLECILSDKPDTPISVHLDDERQRALISYDVLDKQGSALFAPTEVTIRVGTREVWRINRSDLSLVFRNISPEIVKTGQCRLAEAPPQAF